MVSLWYRLPIFILLCYLFFWGFFWWSLPLTLWYLYNFPGYELIGFAILLDIYFDHQTWPLYSLATLVMAGASWWVKKYLVVYTGR